MNVKLSAFEDGLKAGKMQTVDYIKKYANFCLASTALSFYFARCDGTIDAAEQLEIEHDLDSIIKNRDLPEALRNKLAEISLKEDLSFVEVSHYLDGVGIETLMEFSHDIDEIIMADENVTTEEERAKVPYYDSVSKTWRVVTEWGREEGDAIYIASEFVKDSLYYPFHSAPSWKEEHHNHAHEFASVVSFLLKKPDFFSIVGLKNTIVSKNKNCWRI